MKTTHSLYKYALALVLMMTGAQQLLAQDAFYIYRNDGNFDGFFFDEIVRMGYSKTDLDSVEHDVYVVQEIETADSLYRIPLAAIDSIGFQQPEIRMNPKFKNMDELGITPYVTSVHAEGGVYHLGISKTIPSDLLPQIGDVVASWSPSIYGNNGFVVKIREESEPLKWYQDENDQSYYWIADGITELSDVFDQFITVEDIGVDEEGNAVCRRIAGCNPDGTIRRATTGDKEVNLLNISGTFTREWKSGGDSSIGLSAEVGVLLKLRVAYNITWRRLFVKLSRDLVISAKPSLAMSVSKGFDYSIDDFLPLRLPVVIFPATCPIFQTSPIPEWFVRGEGKLEAKLNLPAVQLGFGEDIIVDTDELFPVSYEPRLYPTVQGSVDDALDLGSAEVSLSGYLQTGLKFKADLMTASWFSKIFQGDIGLFLYCGPKIGGQVSYNTSFAENENSTAFYNSLSNSYLHSELISFDLEAKATAAAFWSDPEEKKFFDKNWSFFTDTVRFVPQFDNPEIIVNGKNTSVTIHPKGGRTIGYCTMTVGIYDTDKKLVKTVGDWTYGTNHDEQYYTTDFSLDDLKSGVPYEARTLLTWAGYGPVYTDASTEFYKKVSVDIDDSPLEFDATEDLEKRVRFVTDIDPRGLKVEGNGLVKAVLDTLDKEKGIYEATFTITPNTTPFWDEGEVYIVAGEESVTLKYTQKPCLESIEFNFSSLVNFKMHKTQDTNGETYELDYESDVSSTFSKEKIGNFSNPAITYTLTPIDKDKIKVTASSTIIGDMWNPGTHTYSVEFTMVFKKNDSYDLSYDSGCHHRIFYFDIVDGRFITKNEYSRSDGGYSDQWHSECIQDFACEGCWLSLESQNYVNKKMEFIKTNGDIQSASCDSYYHSTSSGEWGSGYSTETIKGTLNTDGYNYFHISLE